MLISTIDFGNALLYYVRRPTSFVMQCFSVVFCFCVTLIVGHFLFSHMTIIDNRLNRTMFVLNQPPAAFPAGKDSFALNLDATVGEGIDIFGFEGMVDFNAADLAGLLAVQVYILRNGRITTEPIATQFDANDFDIVYFAASEDIGDRELFRDFSIPLRLDKGSQYTILFVPNTANPANNYQLFFSVRGRYLTKENLEAPKGYYSQPR